MLGVSTFLNLSFRMDVSNFGAILAQDPPNKWLLEGIATGEQAAFETGRLEDQVINPSPVGGWIFGPI